MPVDHVNRIVIKKEAIVPRQQVFVCLVNLLFKFFLSLTRLIRTHVPRRLIKVPFTFGESQQVAHAATSAAFVVKESYGSSLREFQKLVQIRGQVRPLVEKLVARRNGQLFKMRGEDLI